MQQPRETENLLGTQKDLYFTVVASSSVINKVNKKGGSKKINSKQSHDVVV